MAGQEAGGPVVAALVGGVGKNDTTSVGERRMREAVREHLLLGSAGGSPREC